ncbi:MAG TPA: transposase [Polyangiaceae bacterium]|nr:transposase [Polyangiaceae bacterium]
MLASPREWARLGSGLAIQAHLALDEFSMAPSHVSTKWGLSWSTVRRAELDAIDRWDRAHPPVPLVMAGVDGKWLGRRHKRKEKFVTIVSNLETGVPVWIGYGRDGATLKSFLGSLTPEQKAALKLFAVDMHEPSKKAIHEDHALAHAAIVHDPFHVIKRAGEAVTELRRAVFFRAGPELREVGRGSRWLVLRAWEKSTDEQQSRLRRLFRLNGKLSELLTERPTERVALPLCRGMVEVFAVRSKRPAFLDRVHEVTLGKSAGGLRLGTAAGERVELEHRPERALAELILGTVHRCSLFTARLRGVAPVFGTSLLRDYLNVVGVFWSEQPIEREIFSCQGGGAARPSPRAMRSRQFAPTAGGARSFP